MKCFPIVLRCIIIISLLSGIANGATGSEKPGLVEQAIKSIRNCMEQSPVPWPDEWKREYIATIRKAIELHRDVPHYAVRLEILNKGFAPYWESFTKTQDRFLFEVYRTRMHWYTENLMGTTFPSEAERQKLRYQYTDIWNYAASLIIEQFPFLDPNAVHTAKGEDLSVCYNKIDAPLMPVYLRPMSEEQVAQMNQRWNSLRYIRIDLWRRLNDRLDYVTLTAWAKTYPFYILRFKKKG